MSISYVTVVDVSNRQDLRAAVTIWSTLIEHKKGLRFTVWPDLDAPENAGRFVAWWCLDVLCGLWRGL